MSSVVVKNLKVKDLCFCYYYILLYYILLKLARCPCHLKKIKLFSISSLYCILNITTNFAVPGSLHDGFAATHWTETRSSRNHWAAAGCGEKPKETSIQVSSISVFPHLILDSTWSCLVLSLQIFELQNSRNFFIFLTTLVTVNPSCLCFIVWQWITLWCCMTATSRVWIGGMKRRRRTTSWTLCTNTGFRTQWKPKFCSAWSKAFRKQTQVCVHIETTTHFDLYVRNEILTYCLLFIKRVACKNHCKTIFCFCFLRDVISALLAHGGLQAEEVPASSGPAALREFGVQDPALREERKTGARRRRERGGDDRFQGEEIKAFPSDNIKSNPGAKPWSRNPRLNFYVFCFDF